VGHSIRHVASAHRKAATACGRGSAGDQICDEAAMPRSLAVIYFRKGVAWCIPGGIMSSGGGCSGDSGLRLADADSSCRLAPFEDGHQRV
jgi:hypothetical protein